MREKWMVDVGDLVVRCRADSGPRLLRSWGLPSESGWLPYIEAMNELPLDEASGDVTAAAHDAARGEVVYLTEHGERLAAIVPAEIAAELENLSPEECRGLPEDFADAAAARHALAEDGEPIPLGAGQIRG